MSVERLLWESDAVALSDHIRKGDVSPAEVVEAAISRAERINPEINAVAERLYEDARARAQIVDRSLPLAGVPFAIKDLGIAVKGVTTYSGSRSTPFTPDFDSTLTRRYREAGLIHIATSTSPEHGLRLMTESERFGITRNPWNVAHTSGGSSGGAAALVAAGIVPVAHASDGGGSIRVPAACTGLVGLKPSRGRIPLTPLVSEAWFGFVVDHALTRSVRDSALLLDLTHGADELTPYVARSPRESFATAAARDPGKLSLAVYRKSPLGLEISAETNEALAAAVALAREGGHSVEEIDLAFIDRAFISDFARAVAAAVAATARLEAARLGRAAMGEFERGTRILARFGEIISAGELQAGLERLQRTSRRLLEETRRFDAVLMPLLAHPPLAVGAMDPKGVDALLENMLDKLALTRLLRIEGLFGQLLDKSLWFTHWPAIQNVTGQPAIALPVYVTASGLPLGIQAVGRPGDEEMLLSIASQFEKISGWTRRRAPMTPA